MTKMIISRLGSMLGAGIAGAAMGSGVSAAEITAAITLLLGVGVDAVVRRMIGAGQ